MILPCNSVSANPKSKLHVKPAPIFEVGSPANTLTPVLPQSISPSGPTANTCNDNFPSDSDITMRAMPVVFGLELIQTPGSAPVSIAALDPLLSTRSLSCANCKLRLLCHEVLIQLRIINRFEVDGSANGVRA